MGPPNRRDPMRCSRRMLVLGLGAIAALLLESSGRGELLPTKGTFRGIYRVGRGGAAEMNFFILSDKLKAQLAPFDRKYVEIEVKKGSQFGDLVFVDEIGKVTQLPESPLELKLSASPGKAGVVGTVDLTCRVINRGHDEL